MEYNVTFVRFGFATVDAASQSEAFDVAKDLKAEDIVWSDDYEASDVQDAE